MNVLIATNILVRLVEPANRNGWRHWYYVDETTGQRRVIDLLRDQVRRTMV